ncbi:NADH-quinone oxidoreductase subunit NuoK [Myxococcota bacterium]|nr:NADH-quinone oxidoreductase subunit NuoK [Myxococcota bacterium]
MTSVPLTVWILLSLALVAIGVAGVLTRRNLLIALMSLEILLNGVNLAFLSFARFHGDTTAHAAVLVVMAVAAAEVAVGLALGIAIFRHTGSLDLDRANRMKG